MTATDGGDAEAEGAITLTLTGDRRDVEAMALEFRRLAKAHGLEIGAVQTRSADESSEGDEAERGSGETG